MITIYRANKIPLFPKSEFLEKPLIQEYLSDSIALFSAKLFLWWLLGWFYSVPTNYHSHERSLHIYLWKIIGNGCEAALPTLEKRKLKEKTKSKLIKVFQCSWQR